MSSLLTDYERFGDINEVAIDVCLRVDPDGDRNAPYTSRGSWGAWKLWIAGKNLCRLTVYVDGNPVEVDEVRWYLAPLFRWILEQWDPILHESRLPDPPSRSKPGLSARSEYLSRIQWHGDNERFSVWQDWANRHSIRSCSEGGILPDVFMQRVGDEIEVSWGDRIAPGSEGALFILEPGVARASVSSFALVLDSASNWFLSQNIVEEQAWYSALLVAAKKRSIVTPEVKLSWFLDSQSNPGRLFGLLTGAYNRLQQWLDTLKGQLCLAPLAPPVAMFGALSPNMSEEAATLLVGALFSASSNVAESVAMQNIVEEIPAWASESPWDVGYQLALEVMEEAELDVTTSYTDIDRLIEYLGVQIIYLSLGEIGPRGVAIAGSDFVPTIVINKDSVNNLQPAGERFTIAHELCHLLYDRNKAKSIFHASAPWAHPAVEQRANAFAAMLLMPPARLSIDIYASTSQEILNTIVTLSEELLVGKTALIHHLANLSIIDDQVRDEMLSLLQK